MLQGDAWPSRHGSEGSPHQLCLVNASAIAHYLWPSRLVGTGLTGKHPMDSSTHRPPPQGGEVFKFAVRSVPQVVEKALADAGMQKEQIDWLVLHQVHAWGACGAAWCMRACACGAAWCMRRRARGAA